ncbi:receptor-like protein kinase, partial [Trifolium medium]|nr:receptor-like protein kinase [Trifolium medium]
FDEVLGHEPDPSDGLKPLVDPRLGDNYSFDSIYKMTQIAKACTMNDPQLRPNDGTWLWLVGWLVYAICWLVRSSCELNHGTWAKA